MTKDMTMGSPLRMILLFSVPVLLGNIFQQFYNMVDTIIVGQYLGEDALAALLHGRLHGVLGGSPRIQLFPEAGGHQDGVVHSRAKLDRTDYD